MLKIAPICCDQKSVIVMEHSVALLLVKNGDGILASNDNRIDLLSRRIFLIRDHRPIYVEDGMFSGLLIEFQQHLLDRFLLKNIFHYDRGIFQEQSLLPFADLREEAILFLLSLISQLEYELERGNPFVLITHYFFMLLLHINKSVEEKNLLEEKNMHKLNLLSSLIDQHFMKERGTTFYAKQLGMTDRKLNELTKSCGRKKVFDLIIHRLMLEVELSLKRGAEVKELIYELGFGHQSHLDRYFKKYSGYTSSEYRKMLMKK